MKDPFEDRESENYERPIASREFIIQILTDAGKPLSFDDIADDVEIQLDQEEALQRRLMAMCRDAQIASDREGRFMLVDKTDLIAGRFSAHPDGFGFVIRDDGEKDLFVHDKQAMKVYDGDRVLVRAVQFRGRNDYEAKIVEVTDRAHTALVGQLKRNSGVWMVEPRNRKLVHPVIMQPDQIGQAEEGQFVSVELTSQPSHRASPTGRIVQIIGHDDDPGIEIAVAVGTHDLPHEFSQQAIDQADAYGEFIDQGIAATRKDLRALPFCTIDGEDARDFDDAVFAQRTDGGGWKLWVAIADVAEYVKPGMQLDTEAVERATSVYFPRQVIPMLPEALSNGLCSLNPDVDRLAMVAEINVSARGAMTRVNFHEGVFRSHARLTYNQVNDALEDGAAFAAIPGGAAVQTNITDLYSLYHVLKKVRAERGAIEFEAPEPMFQMDANGHIAGITGRWRGDSHKLIEECMLLANVAAAKYLIKHEKPSLYRVHEGPSVDKLIATRAALAPMGLHLQGGDEPTPEDYQAVMEQARGRPDESLIQVLLLRSMSQARYEPDAKGGHFGLGYEAYTHFTSPIRRYPDLMVHRALKSILRKDPSVYPYDQARLETMGEHCSNCERRADDASRDVNAWLKCRFMTQHIGSEFTGVVTGVAPFGLFITLNDMFVEGMVHVTALPADYYRHDATTHSMVGEQSGQTFRLADELKVRVVRVDMDTRRIDFDIPGMQPAKDKKGKKKSRKKGDRGPRR
ncbi:ribonuclease R [Litorivicinus lipolyticus]|uniref:Ribonuclease R n=1 Tax=Litorivicinus lipolyticus TaxID=418701 RepID=A0A5Q2QC58_9GAMM|nr:ribonuclease R [Litorivicinus lipolyticus]QGG79420.1 ribonuclease R [Litorivicinus lipolyticus]